MAEDADLILEDIILNHIMMSLIKKGFIPISVTTVVFGGTNDAILFKRLSQNIGRISIFESELILEPSPDLQWSWHTFTHWPSGTKRRYRHKLSLRQMAASDIMCFYRFKLANPDVLDQFFKKWAHLNECAEMCGHIKIMGD